MSATVDSLMPDASHYIRDSRSVSHLEPLPPGTGCRASTLTSYYQAVERVILTMRPRLSEPFSLQAMAQIAIISPFHFNRVFRRITGLPPARFLYALRLEAAKRLLLTTQLSVTDVCYEVGYNSLGTFTTRFAQLVGLPPRHLRRLAVHGSLAGLASLGDHRTHPLHDLPSSPSLTGQIRAPARFAGLIFAGLFRTPIPQSQPVGCTILTEPGTYRIAPVPDGRYSLFAIAVAQSDDPLAYLLHDAALRGSVGPLLVRKGRISGRTDITLRPAMVTDPPLLVALPFLLTRRLPANAEVTT
jgi:AraC family transcriptional regulator